MKSKYNHDEISSFVERLSQTEREQWTEEDLAKIKDYSKYIDSFTHNDPHPEAPNRTNQSKDFNETEHRGSAMYTSPEFDKHIQYQIDRAKHKNVKQVGNMEVYDNEDFYPKEPGFWAKLKEKVSLLNKT